MRPELPPTNSTYEYLLLIEDQPVVRDLLCLIISKEFPEAQVISASGLTDSNFKVNAKGASSISLALIDLNLSGESYGVSTVKEFNRVFPSIPVLVMSGLPFSGTVAEWTSFGVRGYVAKSAVTKDLLEGLKRVMANGLYFPDANEVNDLSLISTAPATLTERQVRIISLLAEGHSDKQIARTLGISDDTVGYHLRAIFRRLGVSSRSQAVGAAYRIGLLGTT